MQRNEASILLFTLLVQLVTTGLELIATGFILDSLFYSTACNGLRDVRHWLITFTMKAVTNPRYRWENWDSNLPKATQFCQHQNQQTSLNVFLSKPMLILPPCASLLLEMLSISLSLPEAGLLRTLGNVESKFHHSTCLALHRLVILNLCSKKSLRTSSKISFLLLLILTPVPFQPPQLPSSSFCCLLLTFQIL